MTNLLDLRRLRCHGGALLVSLGLATAATAEAPPAVGQSRAELVRARELYAKGLTQEAAGEWAGALATFKQVARVKSSPNVSYHIARCKENLGRLNEALGGYKLAEYAARREGTKASVLEAIVTARESLEKRIPKLVIQRGEGADTTRFELDGVALGAAKIGKPVNVDPGPHVITGVTSEGKRFKVKAEAVESETKTVAVDVPEALREDGDSSPGGPRGRIVPAAQDDGDDDRDNTDEPSPPSLEDDEPRRRVTIVPPPRRGGSVLPWVVGGVGVASLAASGVLYFVLRAGAEGDLNDGCLDDVCPESLRSTADDGALYSTLAGVTLGVGVAGVVGAGILLLTTGGSGGREVAGAPPRRQAGRRPIWMDVDAGPDRGVVTVGGSF